jgi:hypothetical protein
MNGKAARHLLFGVAAGAALPANDAAFIPKPETTIFGAGPEPEVDEVTFLTGFQDKGRRV